jgi:hypothetical protein
MLRMTKVLVAVALCGGLSACATYDYGYSSGYYPYSRPYYGYGYDYGPYYYDYGPYYYGVGPGYYVGPPAVGFDFRYRDRGRYDRSDRRYSGSRGDHRGPRPTTGTAPNVQRGGRTGATPTPGRTRVSPAPVARANGGRAERPANRSEQRATVRAEQ